MKFFKTVGTMSALFGLMSKGEDKKKVNNQKKRFYHFYTFPKINQTNRRRKGTETNK